MKMEINTWTKRVLESYKRKKDVPLSEQLLNRLYDIPNHSYSTDSFKLISIFYLAASIIILLGFNLFSWISMHQIADNSGSEILQYFNYINTEL
jgi:hypothetical protein